jgi:uracil DNA glycosylase
VVLNVTIGSTEEHIYAQYDRFKVSIVSLYGQTTSELVELLWRGCAGQERRYLDQA